jgi:hypothetical protein
MAMHRMSWLLCVLLAAALVVPGGVGEAAKTTAFDQMKAAFNGAKGTTRLVLLTSPTCPACVGGAKWVQEEILDKYPELDLRVYAVWYEMYPGDSPRAFPSAQKLMPDARVQHFWDQPKATGRWFKANVPSDYKGKIMWDAYYLYGPDVTWERTPGAPLAWGRTILETRKALLEQIAALDEVQGQRSR